MDEFLKKVSENSITVAFSSDHPEARFCNALIVTFEKNKYRRRLVLTNEYVTGANIPEFFLIDELNKFINDVAQQEVYN